MHLCMLPLYAFKYVCLFCWIEISIFIAGISYLSVCFLVSTFFLGCGYTPLRRTHCPSLPCISSPFASLSPDARWSSILKYFHKWFVQTPICPMWWSPFWNAEGGCIAILVAVIIPGNAMQLRRTGAQLSNQKLNQRVTDNPIYSNLES